MKLSLLTIALVAAAGTASAQTVTAPNVPAPNAGAGASVGAGAAGAAGTTSYSVPSTSDINASASANMANAPTQRMTGAAGTAQKRIEQDGYKSVQNLQKGADGLWHGTAMRGNTQVKVTVDRAGRVAAQ